VSPFANIFEKGSFPLIQENYYNIIDKLFINQSKGLMKLNVQLNNVAVSFMRYLLYRSHICCDINSRTCLKFINNDSNKYKVTVIIFLKVFLSSVSNISLTSSDLILFFLVWILFLLQLHVQPWESRTCRLMSCKSSRANSPNFSRGIKFLSFYISSFYLGSLEINLSLWIMELLISFAINID
jgi:hypothetical protein